MTSGSNRLISVANGSDLGGALNIVADANIHFIIDIAGYYL